MEGWLYAFLPPFVMWLSAQIFDKDFTLEDFMWTLVVGVSVTTIVKVVIYLNL